VVGERSDGLSNATTPPVSPASQNGNPGEALLGPRRLRPDRRGGAGSSSALPAPRVPRESGSWWRFLRVNLFWIVGITLVVTIAAGAAVELMTPMYKATAEVVVYPPLASADSSLASLVMGTEKGVAESQSVLSMAALALQVPASTLEDELSVTVPVDGDLLEVSIMDASPQRAEVFSQGVADAYVDYRAGNPSPSTPQAEIISNASLPTAPSSPTRKLDVGVALCLGLCLGLGVAWLRDTLDDRVRGVNDLEAQAEVPVLGVLPAFRTKKSRPADRLVVVRDPDSRVTEAYRNLRTRLLQIAGWREADTLLVTSPGREDKTTVAANLSAALALSGRRVILVSADLRQGRVHELFGLDNSIGLTSLLTGEATLANALRDTEIKGLQLLSSGPAVPDPATLLQLPALFGVLGELRDRASLVVIDAPSVLSSADTGALVEVAKMVMVVGDARLSTRQQVRMAIDQLGHVRDRLIGCVLDNVGASRRLPPPRQASGTKSPQPVLLAAASGPTVNSAPDSATADMCGSTVRGEES
jgi:succinoglycan biosynthesis transport protein ExoP